MSKNVNSSERGTPAGADRFGTSSPTVQIPSLNIRSRSIRAAQHAAAVVPVAVLLAALGVVLATYWPALSAGAQYMDDKYYIGTSLMQHPSWASVKAVFGEVLSPSVVNGYYQPLAQLSVMLDFLDPTATNSLLPFHRTALALHLLNVALVVVFLHLLFNDWITAGSLGLLYGVHPLNADAVLWIAERKTLLSTCFVLSSLLLYVTYRRHADQAARGDWKRYLASLFLYGCALLSKPTALPLPGLLLVLDYWPAQRRFNRATLLEKAPFFIVGALFAVVAVISQARAGQDGGTQVMNPLYTPLVVAYCAGFYLLKTVCPVGLVSDYLCPQPFGLMNTRVLGNVIVAAGVIAAIVLSARRTRAWVAGGLFFLIAISPTVGVIRYTSSIAANRSMYLPMLGLLLPLAWGLHHLWNANGRAVKVSGVRLMVVVVGATLATGSVVVTRSYESHWHDSLTLLQYYLTQAPTDWKLHTRLGNEWIQRGNYPSAIAAFREAVSGNPKWTENHLNLGRALFTVGEYPEARQSFATALQQTPDDWRAHMLMGSTLARQNHLEAALKEFRTAAELAPTKAQAHFSVADMLVQRGELDGAVKEYQQTLRLDPGFGAAQRALDAISRAGAWPAASSSPNEPRSH
jgi:protein O-mannosyl-transferase